MRYHWIDEYLLEKPAVTKDLQAEWNWIRYQIGGKMFAAVCLDGDTNKPVYITLKLKPEEGDFFRQQYEDIIPITIRIKCIGIQSERMAQCRIIC